jgi:hypothetical protein
VLFWTGIALCALSGVVVLLAGHFVVAGFDFGIALGLVLVWSRARRRLREAQRELLRLTGDGAGS